MPAEPSAYWDRIVATWSTPAGPRLWRSYSDLVNARLLGEWLPTERLKRVLKTDCFDEATGDSGIFLRLRALSDRVVGIDISPRALSEARARNPDLRTVGSDVSRLPFADATFDVVVSNSTLDHLDTLAEIGAALGELRRVLHPGGRLILTLDNRCNPVIALRSVLPQSWLTRLHLVPYRVGANCGPEHLASLARVAGLEIEHVGSIMHCPRLPAVVAANLFDRLARAKLKTRFVRALLSWERLERWPTRFYTGYFVSLIATRVQ